MVIQFKGKVFIWRGPSPYYFVAVPAEQSRDIKTIASLVTYGWGVIPVQVLIGQTSFQTSLFPKGDLYLVPLKDKVRKGETIDEGDSITVQLEIRIG